MWLHLGWMSLSLRKIIPLCNNKFFECEKTVGKIKKIKLNLNNVVGLSYILYT